MNLCNLHKTDIRINTYLMNVHAQCSLRCPCWSVWSSTDPGQQPYGLQEALSVGRVEDPNLQQVLVLHHIAALQSNKTAAKVSVFSAAKNATVSASVEHGST